MEVLRKTESVCLKCFERLPANIIEEKNKVYLVKTCKKHGKFKILLSKDPKYYKELSQAYFSDFRYDPRFKRNYFNIYLTFKCNLNCPICLTRANEIEFKEPSLKLIKKLMKNWKNTKIGLWGGEPTLREDLPEIIKAIKESGNIPALYTNGIKISDIDYLKKLKTSGLNIVHLQFDGFDDKVYQKLRKKSLIKIKEKTLDNLKGLSIPTVLETTFVKGLNEKEMLNIFEFALKNDFIKAILYRSYSFQGKAGFKKEKELLGEELLERLEKDTKGKISKQKILEFQKLLFFLYELIEVKRCFYNQYMLIKREKQNYKTMDEIINLKKILKNIERYKKIKNKNLAKIYLAVKFFPLLFNLKILPLIIDFSSILVIRKFFKKYFTSSTLPNGLLILGFGCICNAYNYDKESTMYCIGGEILGNKIFSSLVESNFARESSYST